MTTAVTNVAATRPPTSGSGAALSSTRLASTGPHMAPTIRPTTWASPPEVIGREAVEHEERGEGRAFLPAFIVTVTGDRRMKPQITVDSEQPVQPEDRARAPTLTVIGCAETLTSPAEQRRRHIDAGECERPEQPLQHESDRHQRGDFDEHVEQPHMHEGHRQQAPPLAVGGVRRDAGAPRRPVSPGR